MKNYTCYHISNKPELFPILQECMKPESVDFHDGTNIGSFSKLVNTCVEKSPTEVVAMMSDKVRPNVDHLYKLLKLLEDGYAFVGLYRFAFFGFKKELFRQIGPMDERFIGGGHEDNDFCIRLKEANLGVYLSIEVPYNKSISGWNYDQSLIHFENKWGDFNSFKNKAQVIRNLNEEIYNYNLGMKIDTSFLSWKESKFLLPSKKMSGWTNLIVS